MTRTHAPITYRTAEGESHAPMLHAVVAGTPTRLILDTGASEHVLTVELARRAGLALAPDEPGTDAAGDPVPSWRIASVPAVVAGWEMTWPAVPAMEGPPPFAGWGIGGFASPQGLHPTASIVLDLAASGLTIVDEAPERVAAALQAGHPELVPVWLERVPEDTTVLVRAAIAGYPEVVTLIDSGARSTSFAAAALPGLVGGAEAASGRALGGREMLAPVVDGASLAVGGARLPISRLFVVPDATGRPQGVVGMDVLRGTVLMVAADLRRPVLWLVPR